MDSAAHLDVLYVLTGSTDHEGARNGRGFSNVYQDVTTEQIRFNSESSPEYP